jgi:hypothetical protein
MLFLTCILCGGTREAVSLTAQRRIQGLPIDSVPASCERNLKGVAGVTVVLLVAVGVFKRLLENACGEAQVCSKRRKGEAGGLATVVVHAVRVRYIPRAVVLGPVERRCSREMQLKRAEKL